MFKRILVATDGSELSEKAVVNAIALAEKHGAELIAFTVARRLPKSYMDGAMIHEAAESGNIEKRRLEMARATVDAIGARAAASGVKFQAVVAHSSQIAESIIDAAGKHDSDLIVMASHGRGGLGRLLLGSETQHVLTHSTLPVLVFR